MFTYGKISQFNATAVVITFILAGHNDVISCTPNLTAGFAFQRPAPNQLIFIANADVTYFGFKIDDLPHIHAFCRRVELQVRQHHRVFRMHHQVRERGGSCLLELFSLKQNEQSSRAAPGVKNTEKSTAPPRPQQRMV